MIEAFLTAPWNLIVPALAPFLGYSISQLGLLVQIIKIVKRANFNPPKVTFGYVARLMGRYWFWVILGLLLLAEEPITGILFIVTRLFGIALTFLVEIIKTTHKLPVTSYLAALLFTVLIGILAHAVSQMMLQILSLEQAGDLAKALVAVFFCLTLWDNFNLGRENFKAYSSGNPNGGLGSLRWFQWGMLINFLLHFCYGLYLINGNGFESFTDSTGWFIVMTFGAGSLVQAFLLVSIELCVRESRAARSRLQTE